MSEDLKPIKQYEIKSLEERFLVGKEHGPMKQLIGPLMMEGNLSMVFGRFGVGKSALAFQIAFAVATGKRLFDCLPNECKPMKVLYFDGELEDIQIYDRLQKDGKFPKNIDFIFENLDYEPRDPKEKIFSVLDMVEAEVRTKKYQFIIIDNLHTLGERLEESTSARMIMKQLKRIKRLGVSVLVVAHGIKGAEYGALESNRMQGSEVIRVYLDTLIGIGKSQRISDDSMKYLINLKNRDNAEDYNQNRVISTQLTKDNKIGLIHEFVDICPETEHYLDAIVIPSWKEAVKVYWEQNNKKLSINKMTEFCIDVLKVNRGNTTIKAYMKELNDGVVSQSETLGKPTDRPDEQLQQLKVIGGQNG